MAARTMRVRHQDDVRSKIQASVIVGHLMGHVVGKVEMSATQVQAAKILLGKTLPDLSENKTDMNVTTPWLSVLRSLDGK